MNSLNSEDKVYVHLPTIVGAGYKDFWNFKGRYRVVKGSRASKKSTTTALWYIYNLMKYPQANLLVVRKTQRTLRDSCFAMLEWAIDHLQVSDYWHSNKSLLEMTYLPTGQKILFRGMDDPLKITSITVKKGNLCWCWIEEAYEVMNEDDFNKLDGSIRGKLPQGLFNQITLTFNPWSDRHWLKARFFDTEKPYILAKTTNYTCNEFLDASDNLYFEELKSNPKRFRVEGLGEWGIVEGVVFENWKEEYFNIDDIRAIDGIEARYGLDFGYSTDPTALFCGLVDKENKKIYVFDELYKKKLTNQDIYKELEEMGLSKEKIIADSAEPKSIQELRLMGMRRIQSARKGKDSIRNGIQKILNYEIIVHPQCVNFLREISLYSYGKDKWGQIKRLPADENNHLMDAMRYALEGIDSGSRFEFM